MRKKLLMVPLVLVSAFIALAVPLAVRAEDGSGDSGGSGSSGGSSSSGGSGDSSQTDQQTAEAQKKAAEQAAEQAKKLAEQRQEAAKQREEQLKHQQEQENQTENEAAKEANDKAKDAFEKACSANSESFQNRVKGIHTRATQHITVLNNIDDRVEAYVKDHNLTVANYDTLLTAVKTQRQLVATLETAAEQATFTCGTDKSTAQASLAAFKDAYQQELNAIAAYKTALKNLIAAVKAAAQTRGTQ